MSRGASFGGAAAAGGMDFQHRVAAWVAVHVLAEKAGTPLWDLPSDVVFEWFRCETEQPIDDLLVGASNGGLIFCQIKRRLNLSSSSGSDLASALNQFVRQFTACRNLTGGSHVIDRPLDPARDRLVLITSLDSSKPIRTYLPNVLRRARNLTPGQALDDAAANEQERKALSVVLKHIRNSWQAILSAEPSEAELRQLLSLISVQVLDVEAGGLGEQEAKNLLRSAVLRNPDQADQAWGTLVALCAGYAAQRSGADRATLQRELLNAGFDFKAPRSYEEDIKRLQRHSQQTLDALAHLARIRVGSTTIRIPRACIEALRHAAEEGSILVTGEPGVGKSGALHDFAEVLRDDGRDFVLLAVDRLAAQSLGELREELGLEHELPEVLENWPGLQPAFLVIDALDAARGDPAGKMVLDMRQVIEKGGRWRVVASIRKFDLRYGTEIQQLFAGKPPTPFVDSEFQRVRHLNIPRFSDDELSQIGSKSPALQRLITNAPTELRDLLRVPFNLRLMAELLGGGVSPDELTPIRTQLELLDRYWRHRVVDSDGRGDGREAILREVCKRMVKSRMLRADRAVVARLDTSVLLHDLLSRQVLVEWQASPEAQPDRDSLAFLHHVLFDYAVARLLFRGDAKKVINRLASDPDLTIFVRPSLVLHFRHLWASSADRHPFWDLTFQIIADPKIPEVGKLIGPAVAAELALSMQDLEPLCATLEKHDEEKQKIAEQALRHLVGTLLAIAESTPLAGPDAGPWCELLERVSQSLRLSVAYAIRPLLATLCDRPEVLTLDQRTRVGCTARRLLKFAWSQSPRDSRLVVCALQCVCRTFESDPTASALLIRRCLEPAHLTKFGFEEIPALAREVKRLIRFDPKLVADVYCATFAHQEQSEEPMSIGLGYISLTSNRRQDYQMALHELAEAFPEFLESASKEAARALVNVMDSYVAQRYSPAQGKWPPEEVFDFGGQQVRLRTDYSAIWDEGSVYRHHDPPLIMLDIFQRFLEKLAACPENEGKLRALIGILISENRLAVIWRRLLLAGARYPKTIGREILPLAWAAPILAGSNTTVPAGEYLKKIFPILGADQRRKIEQAILSIPDAVPPGQREAAERARDRLLGCLVPEALVTDEARQRLKELQAQNAVPSNEPLVVILEIRSEPYGEEGYLKDRVSIESGANQRIRELERPVKEFADKHLNSTPTLEEVNAILPHLRALHEALERADVDGVHPKQRDHAWGILAAACACVARADGLSCRGEPSAFVKAVLLKASRHPEPAYTPQYDAQFDKFPSWGSPAARIDAAHGLITLACHPDCATPDVLRATETLSADPVPAVRFQIAAHLHYLYPTAHELMWRIIERMAQREGSQGVLQGLLGGPLDYLADIEPDRVSTLTKTIFDRSTTGPGSNDVRKLCMGIFFRLYIWRDHPLARDIVHEIVSHPAVYPAEARHVLMGLRNLVTHGPTDSSDPQADAVRRRALELLERLLRSSRDALKELYRRHAGISFGKWPEADQETTNSLMHLINDIGAYFAEASTQSKQFYQEAGAILDELADALLDAPLPSAAHYLLETLEHFIPVDPPGVFLRIHHVVLAGQQMGYQYTPLVADLIVRLVERYLAEYRTLFQQNADCRRALIEVLDIFVKVGWPSARRLTYRLEEIFR